MTDSTIPAEHLLALYDYNKSRRDAYKEKAYTILGSKCSLCGSADTLRHRFIDPCHPLAGRYQTNPVTLFRRICHEPELQNDLYLICRECRIGCRGAMQHQDGDATPGHKPLEILNQKEEPNGQYRSTCL